MLKNIIFIVCTVCAIACGIGYYTMSQTVKEQNLIIQKQDTELQLKSLEIDNLTKAISEQNLKINEYKENTESYSKEIADLNSQLELEIQKQYIRDHMENQNSSDKEAIEWLLIKRNSISF